MIGHQTFDIVREDIDKLTKKTWSFMLYGTTFVLSEYRDQYKLPPSTNWRNRHIYDRIVTKANTIDAEQIEIPESVEAELLETFISRLTVTKWKALK
jgi:hypothetical protein